MRRCVCGLCAQTHGAPRTSCTLLTDGELRVVERHQTELCKPICISKGSVSLLQRLIRSLLRGVAALGAHTDSFIRLSLQREDGADVTHDTPPSSEPYVFDADFFDGELQGSFFASLDQLGVDHFHFAYNLGEAIDFERHLSQEDFRLFKRNLDRALIEGDGKPHLLVVVCDGLLPRDFDLYGLQFRFDGNAAFRARPVYIFLQARQQHP